MSLNVESFGYSPFTLSQLSSMTNQLGSLMTRAASAHLPHIQRPRPQRSVHFALDNDSNVMFSANSIFHSFYTLSVSKRNMKKITFSMNRCIVAESAKSEQLVLIQSERIQEEEWYFEAERATNKSPGKELDAECERNECSE